MTSLAHHPVLITGGAGYIGSHAMLALLDNGREAVVVDDLSTGRRGAVPAGVPFYEGKIADNALIGRIIREHGCRAVMHFAGSIVVPESVEKPLEYYQNNVAGSAALLRACLDNGIERFVFSSTAAVYDGAGDKPVSEDGVLAPANPYGRSKLITEWMLRDIAAATDLRVAVLRYFNVAGADGAGRSGQYAKAATHLIKRACQTVLGQHPRMDIFGDDYHTPDGTCMRDYIHVSDLAQAHLAVLDHIGERAEYVTMNCGYGHGYSVTQVLDVVDQVAGEMLDAEPMRRRHGPRRAGDAASLVADTGRIRQILNWQPKYDDLAVMAATALAWEKKLMDGLD
ncbi:MAG: UDP-glucose 4-epimerase GalE [Rhodospirillaceae bacterium]|jgi:UDP-glucose 4-epimerase|nr:UDP-glucose 4-epimerase GalE [Rhodospirillaceae bacterium]MBT3974865.1 UDP-glucose 4-epimerase GalE [Rhodospirillaceae bacterium]MBT4742308.1 UDP-glucose 4-epimerase GalE [Rhodospirillaceae bacterium]MBT5130441.1 UDP-glucose 4-epimerase GalE [Rhodospirillaceae bacterium]MBT7837933.1 UDP-glucose 4-epimerase GalE [Rhodospirillaceae bacterium]